MNVFLKPSEICFVVSSEEFRVALEEELKNYWIIEVKGKLI
jgi:hypothetical protein